jgi:prepilin-type N-terminal cleavage/methylation domain-containing protein
MLFNLRKKKGFTLVELMIVVAIIGILAAIAIPAFLRYIKSSKASEAQGIMKKMADGAKAYYTSEQKYAPNGTTVGEPWHVGVATLGEVNSAGMPVPYAALVFPGGTTTARVSTVDNTGTAVLASGNAPQGGEKQIPFAGQEPANVGVVSTLNKLSVAFEDPIYFGYEWQQTGVGPAAIATITAMANFNIEGAEAHTVTSNLSVATDTGEVVVSPPFTTNEFE